jgi:hypothetical protein
MCVMMSMYLYIHVYTYIYRYMYIYDYIANCMLVWFGLQAFVASSVFNANIGAWNMARVTTLYGVCANQPAG